MFVWWSCSFMRSCWNEHAGCRSLTLFLVVKIFTSSSCEVAKCSCNITFFSEECLSLYPGFAIIIRTCAGMLMIAAFVLTFILLPYFLCIFWTASQATRVLCASRRWTPVPPAPVTITGRATPRAPAPWALVVAARQDSLVPHVPSWWTSVP